MVCVSHSPFVWRVVGGFFATAFLGVISGFARPGSVGWVFEMDRFLVCQAGRIRVGIFAGSAFVWGAAADGFRGAALVSGTKNMGSSGAGFVF